MAKSILDIDVNDSAFNDFSEKFEKYRAALGKLPKDWAKVTDETERTKKSFEAIAAAMMAQNAISIERAKRERASGDAVRASAAGWRDIAKSTRDVAGNLLRITSTVLKWTGIAGIFGGLVGAGSLFGIERMASSVAGGRKSAQGLGVTYGEEKAFGINYGSVVDDAHSFLSSVNEMLHDITKRGPLYNIGMTPAEFQGDTAQVSERLLFRLKSFADRTDPNVLGTMMNNLHLDQVTSVNGLMRLRATTYDELAKNRANYAANAVHLDLPTETQTKWKDFLNQMDTAGNSIENVFVKRLVDLQDPLINLSKSFVGLVEKIGDSGIVTNAIKSVSSELDKFAKYIGGKEFDGALKKFLANVDRLGEGLSKVADWFTVSDEYKAAHPDKYPEYKARQDAAAINDWGADFKKNPDGTPAVQVPVTAADRAKAVDAWALANFKKAPPLPPPAKIAGQDATMFDEIDKKNGLPIGTLWAMYGAESSYGTDNRTSSANARGPFQFKSGTAWENGVFNPYDTMDAAEGMGRYLAKLNKQFGSIPRAVAAENWGSGNLSAFLKNGGQLPDETANHIAKVMGGIRARETFADAIGPPSPIKQAAAAGANTSASSGSSADWSGLNRALDSFAQKMTGARIDIYNNPGASVVTQTNNIGRQ